MFHVDQPQGCPHLEGRIMMLPRKEEVAGRIPASLASDVGIFNHPVVLLSRQVHLGNVAVFVITSFDNTPIKKRYRDPARRQPYLPIQPASHPDTSCVLIVAHGKVMKKRSYVNTKNIHEIPFAVLRSCWQDHDLHLEKESYRILTSGLWKQNVTELTIRLRGHGIFERVHQQAHIEIPVTALDRSANGSRLHELGYGAGYTGASSQTGPPTSYGTFVQGSTEETYPGVLTAAITSNARVYDYSRRMYSDYLPAPPRPNDIAFQQNRSTVDDDRDQPGFLPAFVIMACLLVAAWHFIPKN